ncbi:helix-turn-helix domain-containing protein [Streptomyces apocyni]|uniref:helix-turn-helix domain-containing protein n=1 Tax=Streptomyces apocyni TaxID=2654677 RepID=UPI0012EACC5A|nr:helix-turn-helix transcriptional regulator [Streptomyces apocyni]
MTPGTRPPGRPPRSTVFSPWPSLKQLSIELMDARGPIRLADFAEVTHYSIAALSDATSGKRIPTEQFLRAYAKAAAELNDGNQRELLDRWTSLREAALKEREGSRSQLLVGGTATATSALPPALTTADGASNPVVPHPTETTRKWSSKRREASIPNQTTPKNGNQDGEEKVPRRLASLVSQAFQAEKVANRDNVAVHVDPVLGALALGSDSKDIKMLLQDRLNRAGVSLRELEVRLNRLGIQTSKSTLERKLHDDEPISADSLSAMLVCSGASRAEINVWLYHRARIEIASLARHGDTKPVPEDTRGFLTKCHAERTFLLLCMQLGTICVTVLLLVFQLVAR